MSTKKQTTIQNGLRLSPILFAFILFGIVFIPITQAKELSGKTAVFPGLKIKTTEALLAEDITFEQAISQQLSSIEQVKLPPLSFLNSETDVAVSAAGLSTVLFTKSFEEDNARPGDVIILSFTITNQIGSFLQTVGFTDDLEAMMPGLTSLGATTNSCGGTVSGSSVVSFSRTFMAANSSCTFSIELLIPDAPAGIYSNTTSPIAGNVFGGGAFSDPPATANFEVLPRLTFEKTFLDDPVTPGSTAALQFNITNNSSDIIENISFTDDLTALFPELIAISPSESDICGPGSLITGTTTLSLSNGRLSPGISCSFIATVYITNGIATGVYPNTTSMLTGEIGGNPMVPDIAPATDDLKVGLPKLTQLFVDDPVFPGGSSLLLFTLTNQDPLTDAINISFNNDLDATLPGLTARLHSSDGLCGPGFIITGTTNLLVSGGSLGIGASCSFSVTVDVPTGAPVGRHLNSTSQLSATVGSTAYTGEVATDYLDVGGIPELSKSFTDDPVIPGNLATLEFTIKNFNRSYSASNIAFTDDLEATLSGLTAVGLPLASPCGSGGTISGTSLLTYSGGSLGPSGVCTFTVTVQIPSAAAGGIYTNTTNAISSIMNSSNVTGSVAIDTLVIQAVPVLTKSFINNPVAAGGVVTLSFTITNTNLVYTATEIAFQDIFETILPTAVSVPAPDFCGGGSTAVFTPLFNPPPPDDTIPANLTISGANLTPGASCTFSITLNVAVDAPSGIYPNTTTDLTATVDLDTVTSGGATDDLVIVAGPKLLKEFIDDPVIPGNTVTLSYTLSYVLSDDAIPAGEATFIAFTDDLDAALTGLTAVTLPADGFCGAGSQISGTSTITVTGGTLTPDATCTFSVTLSVPSTAVPGNYTSNTSDVTASVLGLATTGNGATDDLNIAGVSFSKTFIEGSVLAGQTATLAFTLENVHPTDAATAMLFTDNLNSMISGLAVTGGLPATPCGAGSSLIGTTNLIFIGGELAAGASCTFTVTVQIPVATADGDYRNTTGSLSATINGSSVTIDPATATLTVFSDYLEFSKSFIDDPVSPSGNVTLEFTITNTHATTGTNSIAFTDDLDAALSGLTAVSLPADGFCGAGSQLTGVSTLTLSNASLPANTSCTFAATLLVPGSVSLGAVVTNLTSAVTGSTDGGYAVTGGAATDDLQIGFVSFSKEFETPSVASGTSILTFTIQNLDAGNSITELSFSDDLDAAISGMTAVGLPINDVCGVDSAISGTSFLTMTHGAVAASSSCTFTVTVQIPITATAGTYTNTTSALTTNGLTASIPTTATLTIEPPPAFSKSFAPGSIYAGATSTLTFTIDNTASAFTANTLDFIDTFPAGLTIASPSNASTTCTGGTLTAVAETAVLTYTNGTIATGTACTVQVDVTSIIDGIHVNTTGDLTSSSGSSGSATDTLTVTASAELSIAKSSTPDPVIAGNILTYTVTITNNGPSDAQNVIVTDTLPADVTFVSTSGCAEDPAGVPTCSLGTIAVGYTAQYTIQVTVNSGVSGLITNTATVTATTYDSNVADNQAQANNTVQNLDFGDAPDSFSTVLSSDGARHQIGSLFLGSTIDSDADGQPSANADGDDTDGSDDEGGVTFVNPLVLSTTANLNITASGAGLLNGWMDFNADGDWDDDGEQVFSDESLVGGVNALTIAIPASATAGTTYARFRVNSAGGLSFTGLANDGEVEDYAVTLLDTQFSVGDVTMNEGNSGTTALTFVITRTSTGSAASVDIQTADNTAVSTTDYTALPLTTVNFTNGGSLTQTVTVSVTGDLFFENDETFYLNLSNPVNGIIANSQGVGTITNDDTAPTLSINDMSVDEGAGTAVYTITLSATSGLDVDVDYATSDGTATAGDDYTAAANTATITAGATTATFNVSITDDAIDENSETYTVTLSSPVNATIADSEGIGTITDNDSTPTLSINDMSVDEGAGTAVYTITLSAASGLDVDVNYATSDGTATAGDDYTAAANTATITAGTTTATFNVSITDDAIDENSETYTVTLSSPVNATIADSEGVGTITDNDNAPTISIDDPSVVENAGVMTFTVVLDAVSSLDVTVNYATSDGSAVAGNDYTATSGSLTIPSGSLTGKIGVSITDDAFDENTETLTMTLSSPVNGIIGDGIGDGTIADDDGTPSLLISNVTVDEGAGTAVFTVTLSVASGLNVDVNYATSDGSALAGSDYTAASGTASITAGATTATVSVPITDDAIDENSESYTVTLSSPTNATIADGIGLGTITDNDTAPTLSINDATVNEGDGTAVFTITLSAISGLDVDVNYATSDGSALAGSDYTATSGTANITAGATTATISVPITDDAINENSESYTVTLSSPTNATVADGIGLGTITDNDTTPTLSINDATVNEGDGTAVFTITLSAVSGLDVDVNYATSDGTAIAGADYTATSGTSSITAGATTATVSVPITDDAIDENSESYTVTLSSPVNTTIADSEGIGTITDNDSTPTLSINDMSVDEGDGTAVFTITLSAISGLDVDVNYATSDGSALAGSDYTAASGTASITAGATTATISVPITDDAINENSESYTVTLSSPANATVADGIGLGTITDNDTAPTLSINDATVDEGAGTAVFTITLSAVSGLDVDVNYATSDGTAIAGADYTATSGTANITAGTTTATVSVPITDDTIDENSESYTVTLSSPTNATITDGIGLGTITDNDNTPSLSINDMSVDEGDGTAVFTITLSAISGLDVDVNYATSDGSALAGNDYTAASGTASITAGATTATVSVPITDDAINENSESYTVTLSSPVNATLADAQGIGTIIDNDGLPFISFSSIDYEAAESGGDAIITVTLSAASGLNTTVDYASSDITATSGSDYTAVSGTLTILAGQTAVTFTLPVINDNLHEVSETLLLTLSTPVNASIGDENPATLLIIDDDPAPGIMFNSAAYQIDEENGQAVITVTLDAISALDVFVDYASYDGTAAADNDYTAVSGTLTIPAGQTIAIFTTPILSDGIDEEDETVLFNLSNAINAILTTPITASLTIIDNDVTIYLPMIFNNVTMAPDLIVTDLYVSNNQIQVTIKNQGNTAVSNAFWIDVYIDPFEVPLYVNQTWLQISEYGAVWGVENDALPLLPGETLMLTINDNYYHPSLSQLPTTIAADTPIYAQVDSARAGSDYGSINEIHEIRGDVYNNILGPILSE